MEDTAASIHQKQEQMKEAVNKGDYVLAGRLQVEVKALEELQRGMNEAVEQGDYILAGKLQAQLLSAAGRGDEETDETPRKQPKDIRDLMASQKCEFSNSPAQEPREKLFGRDEAKEIVINYIRGCATKDKNAFVGSKFTLLGTSGVKGIGKTELHAQICYNWVKEIPDIKARAIYATYSGSHQYCTRLEFINKNLARNDREGHYIDSLGHLLLVSCGVDKDIAIRVPIEIAIEYIRSKVFDGEDSDGTLVICVDEIITLSTPDPGFFDNEKSQMNLAQVVMSECMGLQDLENGKVIFIFTALLGSMYATMVSGSGRRVQRLPLSLIPLEDVFGDSILTKELKQLIQRQPAVHQLVLSCAGHPRAIMDGLPSATEGWSCEDDIGTQKIITARDRIMFECKFELDYINEEILAEWFDTPPLSTQRREELLSKGILFHAAEGVEYLFPLLLQQWAVKNKESSVFAYHLDGLFDADAMSDQDTEKYMEGVMYHFEALRRKAMAGRHFDLQGFYQTSNVGAKIRDYELFAPVPGGVTSLVKSVDGFEDMERVLRLLRRGYIVVSMKGGEKGIEYLAPYRTVEEKVLVVACVQCKFGQTSVDWSKIRTKMNDAVERLEKAGVQHFPVIYTTIDQHKVRTSTCEDGVYLVEKDVFAFTKRLGILRLHTQKLVKVLADEYPFFRGSTVAQIGGVEPNGS